MTPMYEQYCPKIIQINQDFGDITTKTSNRIEIFFIFFQVGI